MNSRERSASPLHPDGVSNFASLKTAFEGIAVFGRAGKTIAINARMEKIIGRTAEEIPSLKRMMGQFFSADSGNDPLGMEQLRACSESGAYVRVRHARGDERWCRIALSGEDGSLRVHCLDCSSDKEREDFIRESEEKFRTLFEESKDAISFYSPRERTVNQAWLDIFGYTREELNGLDIMKLYVNPEDRTRFEQELEAHGFVRDFEEQLIRKNGEVISCISTARTHRAEDGVIRYFQGILRDITPMKKMIQALRESEEKYRHLVENIQEVIYAVDTRGVITYISPVIESLSGYSARDLLGKSLTDVHYVYPTDIPRVKDAFINTAPGKPNYHEFRFLTRYGDILWFSASVYAVERDKEVTGFQGILVDITKSIQAKRELHESEERLSSFLDSATDSFLLFDPYLNLVEINRTAQKEFSLRKEDILGTSLSSFLKTIRYPNDPLAFIEVLNTGEPSAIKDVSFEESSVDFKVFRVGYGLGIIATNITEQKRAEKELHRVHDELEKRVAERTADLRKANEDLEREIAERTETERILRESEERFRTIFENAGVALLELDLTRFKDSVEELQSRGIADFADLFSRHPSLCGEVYHQIRVVDVNRKAVDIYDASTREQLLAGFGEYYPDRLPFLAKLAESIILGRTGMAIEFEGVTLLKRKRFVQVNVTLPLHPEHFKRVLISITDLTERKQFEDALRAARDTLEERVRERTEVLARTNRDLEREIVEREAAERALHYYSGFQQRISSISTDFINLPAHEIDLGIIHALRIIGEFAGGERGFVYHLSEDGREAVLTHEWREEGIPSRRDMTPQFFPSENDVVFSGLKRFEIVHIPSLSPFSEDAAEERQRYESSHIRSFILVPMIRGGGLVGFFGFESLRGEHAWDAESFSLLKLMGEMLVNALERVAVERRILDYQEKLRSIASELTLTEERERRRIAVELHDRIGQPLAVSRIRLGVLKGQLPPGEFGKTIDEVNAFISEAIGDTRSLIFEISPPILYDLGFEQALEWLVENVQKQHGIAAEFRDEGRKKPLDHNLRILLFQSVRELLVNVVKHALARRVTVTVEREESRVSITVGDDGVGFDVGIIESRSMRDIGFGLFSIRERLEHLGGAFTVESKSGAGTTVKITAPINRGIQS